MSIFPVSLRLKGIIRALTIEAEDYRRAAHDFESKYGPECSHASMFLMDAEAMDHYADLIGEIQRQAANEEEEREVPE